MKREAVIEMLERIYDEATPSFDADEARELLARAVRTEDSVTLHHVHPEWLLKVLERETPRVIAILLRYIPSRQARYIMDRLPSRITERMPHAVDAFSVPTPIVLMLRRRFEAHFAAGPQGHADLDALGAITALGVDELPRFFHDLGVHELALAFADADARSLNILMKRLPESDARRLQERIHLVEKFPKNLARDAKFTILEVNTDEIPAHEFLFEIGLRAFAKACGLPEQGVIRAISLKLEPRVGEWLMSTSHKSGGRGELGKLRQQMVLDRMETLSRAGALGA